MAKLQVSTKRIAIDKANTQVVIAAGIAAFISVFSLVAAHALFTQSRYLSNVVREKEKASKQLKDNLVAADSLTQDYRRFIAKNPNAIGGDPKGTKDNDGDNATLVLDALPSSYDFPALTSSIEKILTEQGLKVGTISGTDDELAQVGNIASPNPQPVEVIFTFSVNDASYGSVQSLINKLQTSIRPIVIDSMAISGGASNMQLTVNAHTYYQPGKEVTITKEVVQ